MAIGGPRKLVRMACFFHQLLGITEAYTLIIRRKRRFRNAAVYMVDEGEYVMHIPKGLPHAEEVESVAHEMVHVKQFACGDLREAVVTPDITETVWKGETYRTTYMDDDYFLSPWEMEARALERWLAYRWRFRE